jgi:uncharacterized membrane protein YqjE
MTVNLHVVALDQPPKLSSHLSPSLVLGVFAALAIGAAIWAIRESVRTRDVVPIAVCLGALICSFNEPIYDQLGKIVYASNHPVAFTAFGRHIPWFLVLGYVPWVGALPVVVWRLMEKGTPARTIRMLSAASFLSVVVVESTGTSLHAWGYYGVVPAKYLVVAPQMSAVPLVGGLLLYQLNHLVQGSRRLLLAVVPTLALPMVYASVSWPAYVALGADLPTALNWFAALAMVGLTVAVVWFVTEEAQRRWRASEPDRTVETIPAVGQFHG